MVREGAAMRRRSTLIGSSLKKLAQRLQIATATPRHRGLRALAQQRATQAIDLALVPTHHLREWAMATRGPQQPHDVPIPLGGLAHRCVQG